jgi:dihydrofolate reductase
MPSADGSEADMANLIYSSIMSLDGYVADRSGGFAWAAPDAEEHAYINELERAIGTHLLGRRMYEVLSVWDSDDPALMSEPETREYAAIWRGTDKIVFSTTLADVSTARTRLERAFDVDAVRELKRASTRDLSVGGPDLAATAIAAGLVDEWHLFVHPVVVGGGTRSMPDDVRVDLELMDERRFSSGVVHARYRTRG